jgi:hypothetical protein
MAKCPCSPSFLRALDQFLLRFVIILDFTRLVRGYQDLVGTCCRHLQGTGGGSRFLLMTAKYKFIIVLDVSLSLSTTV